MNQLHYSIINKGKSQGKNIRSKLSQVDKQATRAPTAYNDGLSEFSSAAISSAFSFSLDFSWEKESHIDDRLMKIQVVCIWLECLYTFMQEIFHSLQELMSSFQHNTHTHGVHTKTRSNYRDKATTSIQKCRGAHQSCHKAPGEILSIDSNICYKRTTHWGCSECPTITSLFDVLVW